VRLDLRSEYLKELGAPQWYARKRLLGAAPSQALIWPEPIVKTEVASRHKPVISVAEPVGEEVSAPAKLSAAVPSTTLDLVGLSAEASGLVHVEPESSVSLPSLGVSSSLAPQGLVEGVEGVDISLVAYKVGALLFVDESAVGAADHSERELLKNIYFACFRGDVPVSDVSGFEWPVFSRMDAVVSAGIEVDALLGRWFQDLLGGQVKAVVYHGRDNQRRVREMLVETGGVDAAFFAFEYSLTDMINRPSIKADYWRFLCAHELFSGE